MSDTFYPNAQGDQVAWNANIITELPDLAATVNISAAELASILADCQMEIFLLTVVEQMADSFRATLYGYVHDVEGTPTRPHQHRARGPARHARVARRRAPPPCPLASPRGVRRGCPTSRKPPTTRPKPSAAPCALEPTGTPFNPTTFVAQLRKVAAIGHEAVQVTVGKGGGQISANQLLMRRGVAGAFAAVGMFTGRSYVDHTPLATPGVPEVREYQLVAMKDDAVIGQPSPIFTVTAS